MRHYEAMYIVHSSITEDDLLAVIEKYKKVVVDNGGEVSESGLWEGGRRRMAYEIAGKMDGTYVLMKFTGGNALTAELDRIFRISEDVIRHLIVRLDSDEE